MSDESAGKRGRNGFLHPYKFYVEVYGSSLRTVKRWVEVGKVAYGKSEDVKDLVDLDDPEKVYVWWSRNMTAKCPDGILQALVKYRKGAVAPVVELAEVDDELVAPRVNDEPVSEEEKGGERMISRLEEMEVKFYKHAQEPGGAKAWLDTVTRLSVAREKVREEEEKAGKLIPVAMAEQLIAGYHGPIEQGVRGLYADYCNVTGQVISAASMERWNAVCDKLFVKFEEEVFCEVH